MTSKEQERKALEKIEKIVNELGEDSYIATAFEGCFEVARTNIENDWGCSMWDRVKSAERQVEGLKADFDHLNATKEYIAKKLEDAENHIETLKHALDAAHCKNSELELERLTMANEKQELVDKFETESNDMAEQLAAKDMEIMKLKAKLFDLMMATK